MLQVRNLTKYYKKLLAVNNLSFDVNPGEIVGLIGPNGAGKTTVLRSIAGIINFSTGNVLVDGYDVKRDEESAKRAIAFVPEVPNPYELLTVREHLAFVAMAFGYTDNFEKRLNDLLERFDLTEKRNDIVASLSKGMKQKITLACAFIHDAKLFLLDEPLIGIDPKGARELKDMLLDARDSNRAILISTHMLDTAERLCDRVIILNRGSVVTEGNLAELHERVKMGADATLEDMFLKLTEDKADAAPIDIS